MTLVLLFILFLLFFFEGCHCPTPIGICAHDLQYFLLGIPFLWPLRIKLQNFHWWRHKKCAHHPVGEVCKDHDHIKEPQLKLEPCFTKELEEIDKLIWPYKNGQEMNQYWEKERSKIS